MKQTCIAVWSTEPLTMASCHGIFMFAPFGLVGLADGRYKNTWTCIHCWGALVRMSISRLSARAATAVPPQPCARLCRLGLGSAMPDLCSVLASPALDVVHALAAPINALLCFFFSTHPPCNMLWDAGCLVWCLPQSYYKTPKVITGLGGLDLARGEKEPVETNMQ